MQTRKFNLMSTMMLSVSLVLLGWAFAMLAPTADARPSATITVQSNADDGTTNVANCPGINCRLRDAIAKASSGDTIDFGGNYTITLASELLLDKILTMDGSGRTVGVSGNNATRVFTITTGISVTLRNLTVADGNFAGNGGGIFNNGTLTVIGGTFTNNQVTSWGAGNFGGGIYNQATLIVMNSAFIANRAGGTSTGAAIANGIGGVATIATSSFTSNQGDFGAGAISNAGNAMTVETCTFTNNFVPAGYGGGGAIWNWSENLSVTNSTFYSNTAGMNTGVYASNGGAILNYGTMTITGSTFENNSVWGMGGAIAGESSTALAKNNIITNSTFRGNVAQTWKTSPGQGGAIYASANGAVVPLTLTNNTFAQNDAASGSNLYYDQVNAGTMTTNLYNTILLQGASSGNCVTSGSPTTNVSNTLTDDTTCGTSTTSVSAIALGAFGNNGGNTKTFPLAYNSVAIDAGNATYCPATDQRGKTRNDLQCDVGAYEMQMSDRNTTQLTPGATMRTFGPPRAGIQVTSGSTNAVTVTKSANWFTQPGNAIRAWWDIAPTIASGWTANLELCYLDATELNGLNAANLHLWRYAGGTWADLGRTSASGNCVQVNGVTGFSRWTLATGNPSGAPTAVTLSSFDAKSGFDLGAWFRQILGLK